MSNLKQVQDFLYRLTKNKHDLKIFGLGKESYVSYSEEHETSAKCLKSLLENNEMSFLLSKEGLYIDLLKTDNFLFYFSFLPTDYGQIEEAIYFKQEISALVECNASCKIIFLNDRENYDPVFETLINSIKKKSKNNVILIDFLSFKEEVLHSASNFKELCMPYSATDAANQIMTPFASLLTVTPDSSFAELFYKMTTMGIRHIPVIDSEDNRKYLRVISRRDLVEKLPPGGAFLPEDVQEECGISLDRTRLKKEIRDLCKKKIREVFPESQNLSIFVLPNDSIEKVISLFSQKQQLGRRLAYVSALPVLDSEGKLDGFISYTDVFKRFLADQTDFLESQESIVDQMATIGALDSLYQLDKLSNALVIFDSTGCRALPVIENDTDDVLVGYLEDVQVKFFNYKERDFANQLGNLGVEYMMVKVEQLNILHPEQRLKEFISQFWQPFNGAAPAPSFAVCQRDTQKHKKLVGILSYVDVFKKWQAWFSQQEELEL